MLHKPQLSAPKSCTATSQKNNCEGVEPAPLAVKQKKESRSFIAAPT